MCMLGTKPDPVGEQPVLTIEPSLQAPSPFQRCISSLGLVPGNAHFLAHPTGSQYEPTLLLLVPVALSLLSPPAH